MSKSDVEFTIGADSSAFMAALGKVHGGLNAVGQAFIGLQGVAATLRTAFTAMMGPIREFGARESGFIDARNSGRDTGDNVAGNGVGAGGKLRPRDVRSHNFRYITGFHALHV